MQKVNKTDSIFIAGQSGMVGSAITRKLKQNGYQNLLTQSRKNLDLLDYKSTENWFKKYHPDIVILAAAKVGGIDANFKFAGDFILDTNAHGGSAQTYKYRMHKIYGGNRSNNQQAHLRNASLTVIEVL